MKTEEIVVDGLSVVLFGQSRESVIIYVHGQGGCAREAEQVANVAELSGYQIIAMDLPEHCKRNDAAKFVPWDAVPEMARIAKYAASRWRRILVCGVSIGAWFSLYAFKDVCVDKYIFISPLLDMNDMISRLMLAAGVSEERLAREKTIEMHSGQTLSYRYLSWVRNNPISFGNANTMILCAENDEIVSFSTVKNFAEKYKCRLNIMPGGEHWFHTPEQLNYLKNWFKSAVEN